MNFVLLATVYVSSADKFEAAMQLRNDAAQAKPAFAEVARSCEGVWRHYPNRQYGTIRGQARYLAGDLPGAIVAFREALRRWPSDQDLQRLLELCRAEVPGSRALPREWRERFSPRQSFNIALFGMTLATFGVARRLTTRGRSSLPVALAGLALLGLVAAFHLQSRREKERDEALPAHVLEIDAVLRTGNGDDFAPRLPAPLPRGSEMRELHRRGGWVQVELVGGEAGWLPEGVLLKIE